MEKPRDRTRQGGQLWVACRTYPDQFTSIRFTHEHERWALTMVSTAWQSGCVHASVFLSVCECRACPKPRVQAGEGHRPTSTALNRQQAWYHPWPCDKKCKNCMQHHTRSRRKIPLMRTNKACSMLYFTKPRLLPSTQPTTPQLRSKPTFTIRAAVHPHKESILSPTGLIIVINLELKNKTKQNFFSFYFLHLCFLQIQIEKQ